MRILATVALLTLASAFPVSADMMKYYVLDAGSKLAGPFDDYYSCSKMMTILQKQTSDSLICAMHS